MNNNIDNIMEMIYGYAEDEVMVVFDTDAGKSIFFTDIGNLSLNGNGTELTIFDETNNVGCINITMDLSDNIEFVGDSANRQIVIRNHNNNDLMWLLFI